MAIRMSRHLVVRKHGSHVEICYSGKDDYTKLNACCSTLLGSCVGQVVDTVLAEPLSAEAATGGL